MGTTPRTAFCGMIYSPFIREGKEKLAKATSWAFGQLEGSSGGGGSFVL
jgi:hypothetical protein